MFRWNQLGAHHSRAFSAKSVSRQRAGVWSYSSWRAGACTSICCTWYCSYFAFLQPGKGALDGSRTVLWLVTPPSFFVICELVQGALSTIDQSSYEGSKQYWLWYQPLRFISGDWAPAGLHAPNQNPLSPEMQPIFSSSHCPLIWSMPQQCVYEEVMGESITKVKINTLQSFAPRLHAETSSTLSRELCIWWVGTLGHGQHGGRLLWVKTNNQTLWSGIYQQLEMGRYKYISLAKGFTGLSCSVD